MKKPLINNYLKALKTLVNDNRITYDTTGNFADKCNVVVYWCNGQVLHSFKLFNDSSIVNYDNLVNDYLAIIAKHPISKGNKQLFSLRYDSKGYCSIAVTDSSNLELFGVSHKRISRQLAEYLFNDIAFDGNYYISDCYNKYITTYDFNRIVLFSL